MEAELKHKEGFLQGVMKKLSNEKFVNNAPAAVLDLERKETGGCRKHYCFAQKHCCFEKQ